MFTERLLDLKDFDDEDVTTRQTRKTGYMRKGTIRSTAFYKAKKKHNVELNWVKAMEEQKIKKEREWLTRQETLKKQMAEESKSTRSNAGVWNEELRMTQRVNKMAGDR